VLCRRNYVRIETLIEKQNAQSAEIQKKKAPENKNKSGRAVYPRCDPNNLVRETAGVNRPSLLVFIENDVAIKTTFIESQARRCS